MPLQKSPRRHITTKKYCLREKKFNGEQHHFSNGSVCVRTAMPKRWLNGSICHREQAQHFRIKHQHRQKKMLSVGAKKKRVKTSRSCSFYVSHFFHPLVRVSFFFIFHTFIFNNHLLNCCLSYTYTTQWISWFDFLLFFVWKIEKKQNRLSLHFFFSYMAYEAAIEKRRNYLMMNDRLIVRDLWLTPRRSINFDSFWWDLFS